jgi:hypothetical protein
MSRGLIFWILMLLVLVLWLWNGMSTFRSGSYGILGGNLVEFILFGLLGWNVFGPAVKG